MLLSFLVALLVLFFVVKVIHKQTILSLTTARSKIDWNRVFFSFTIWALFIAVSTVLLYYANPENFEVNFNYNKFILLSLIALVLLPIQTSAEEYIFRGYLMQGFASLTLTKWLPLVLTSLIFGLLHIANPEVQKIGYIIMVYYIGTGFFLGIITLMDDGM
jgi:membrane protease YdiL (CAAX protease family)